MARSLLLSFAPLLLGGASCPARPADCRHDSSERCLWEQGVAKPTTGSGAPDEGGDPSGDTSGSSPVDATELELTLTSMIEIMRAGLEWPLVDRRARELCRARDERGDLIATEVSLADESGEAWSCPLANLEINGQGLDLEASQGVISLSATGLDEASSEALHEFARTRLDGWCAGEFEEIEGAKLEVFHRCPLPEGPYLVVARFPRDLEAGQWQVSIAIVDAG